MMDVLLLLVGVWFVAVITPGPDFVVIVRYATSQSRWHGVMTAIGSNCGILAWATGAMLGLSVLMSQVSWLSEIVRLAGAAYLIYLGVRTLWSTRRDPEGAAAKAYGTAGDHGRLVGENRPVGLLRAWRAGFLTNLANPKAVAFFGSLLGVVLPAHPSVGLQVMALLAIVTTSLLWYVLVAALFGSAPVVRTYQRIRHWVDRVTGTVLIAFGVRLAADR